MNLDLEVSCDAWYGCQLHHMQILPECDDHCDAHDSVGEGCPPNECQPELTTAPQGGPKTYSIALGRVIDASFSSSDMCAPASGPMKHQIGDANPTKQDNPVLDQPPPLLEFVSRAHLGPSRPSDLLEGCEHLLCRRMIRHYPQRQQKCEETKDMEK